MGEWDYPYDVDGIEPVKTDGLRIYPALRPAANAPQTDVEPLVYTWEGWEQLTFHERKKESYPLLREAFADETLGGHEEETRYSPPERPQAAAGRGG